jgi:hypothetical protein
MRGREMQLAARTRPATKLLCGALLALAVTGCGRSDLYHWGGSGADAGDTGSVSDWYSLYEAVDILIVVDDSESMDEEQVVLGTSQFSLINGLVNPLPDSGLISGLDDVRVAVVSTDMGMSWGGNPYQEGDGWPTAELPCSASGDNGVFQSYEPGKQIKVKDNVIACDESDSQCPAGWSCEWIDGDGVGECAAPFGDTTVDCPWLSDAWAQTPTPTEVPNPDVATQVACLTSLGTQGCGFEQHLESSKKALTRIDQQAFVRDEALLAVIVVSDEDDCSLETKSFYYSPEIQDEPQLEVNIACGENPEYLYPIDDYRQTFIAIKDGNPGAVLFAAIVGVPPVSACQGWGDDIQGCLDNSAMQHEYDTEYVQGLGEVVYYAPACTREVGDVEVTRAAPARRLVQLALEFGNRGYVYSICNDDWSAAMNELAAVIPLKAD